jgi:hypothetical protein
MGLLWLENQGPQATVQDRDAALITPKPGRG